MNSRHIFSALIALTCLAISQSADAMYHTRLGRFIQRDPTGYPDGMNAYAGYHIMHGGVDPIGNNERSLTITGSAGWRRVSKNTVSLHNYTVDITHRIYEFWQIPHKFKYTLNTSTGDITNVYWLTTLEGELDFSGSEWTFYTSSGITDVHGGRYDVKSEHYTAPTMISSRTLPVEVECVDPLTSRKTKGAKIEVAATFKSLNKKGIWTYNGGISVGFGIQIGGGAAYTPPNNRYEAQGDLAEYRYIITLCATCNWDVFNNFKEMWVERFFVNPDESGESAKGNADGNFSWVIVDGPHGIGRNMHR